MKKTILTAMLFFAFLLVGIQNTSAQSSDAAQLIQFVDSQQAMTKLMIKIQEVENNPIYSEGQNQHQSFPDLVLKLNFYTAVYEGVLTGETIPASIEVGVEESDVPDDELVTKIYPIKEEVQQLLEQ